ncbi:arginine esterase-like [Silurus asotus]|uniref:Arginine esterase-like n=1 Tax=Silurus asotus TaxID=30991 RepID=A0AAD5AS97_SILAS|nr:arginine esterase-like [Silurus asotus]
MKVLHVVLLAAAFSTCVFHATRGEQIIHGKKAKKNTLKYMASVQLKNEHGCGGFLINPGYVLTAAHCYEKNLTVVLGTQNIDPNKSKLRRYAVESAIKHPSYKNVISGFDLMLLKLSEKVNPKEKGIKIIKFSNERKLVKPKTKCKVAGWGKTEKQNMVNDLMVVDVSTIDTSICRNAWGKNELPSNILCAGGYQTKNGACQGDSGGPLVCRGLAVGIVSFNLNRNCTYPNLPNVYTEIAPYSNWIKEEIKRNA